MKRLNNEEIIKKKIITEIESLVYFNRTNRSIIYSIFKDLSIDKLNSILISMKKNMRIR